MGIKQRNHERRKIASDDNTGCSGRPTKACRSIGRRYLPPPEHPPLLLFTGPHEHLTSPTPKQ
ncbi:unnamed protein product [Brassica oleracea]|uniref:Uncharacterized protein n=1 Tax=Brassica cretica TaxID=69181 RepID=A0ABQ7CZL4_BRACR|nr:hypothetical protein DY000_02013302 [Brassica cretica]